jgi:hypothetical protein
MKSAVSRPWRVLVKGIVLYVIFEAIFLYIDPSPAYLNIYSIPALKWERFPFRAEPMHEYMALDVGILDTLFASHVISEPKETDEFRVILLGDSATWGAPLPADGALSSQINALDLTCGDRHVRAYNLAYPEPSALKDIVILDHALPYEPDLVIWSVTLLTLTTDLADEHPLFVTEEGEVHGITSQLAILKGKFPAQSLKQDFVHGQISIYRTLRFQSFFPIQLALGTRTDEFPVMGTQLSDDLIFANLEPPVLEKNDVATEYVNHFLVLAGEIPVVVMNEPITVIEGVPNSDVRYNSYYPRWAYDGYREYMNSAAAQGGWHYLDYWNAFGSEYFADTPLHLTRAGNVHLAGMLAPTITEICSHK